jgi:hypothetical protein
MYSYHDTPERQQRLAKGTDHCRSAGEVYEISELIDEGRIRDPDEPTKLLTAQRDMGSERLFIYAVDSGFEMHIGVDGKREQRNAVKHETLFSNADIRAAGEVDFSRGVISMLNDASGSYGTRGMMDVDPSIADSILVALERSNAPVRQSVRRMLEQKAGR